MAIAVNMLVHGGGADLYDRVDRRVRPPGDPPPGLLFHAVGPAHDGWRIFEVWETLADRERFVAERLGPALAELGIDVQVDTDAYELHSFTAPAPE